GRRLATAAYIARSITLYDLPGNELKALPATAGSTLAYHPASDLAARVTAKPGQVVIDVASGQPICVPSGFAYALSDDGKALRTPVGDGEVIVYDLPQGKERKRLPAKANTGFLAVSPGGRYVCVTSPTGSIQTWDVEKGEALPDFGGHLYGCAILPGGNSIL